MILASRLLNGKLDFWMGCAILTSRHHKSLLCFLGGVCNTYVKILFIFFEKECEHDELVVILEYYT